MNKKSQINSEIVIYGLLVVIGVVILSFGIKMFGKFMEGKCHSEIRAFRADIIASVEALAKKPGNTDEKSYSDICGADALYFVDTFYVLPEMFSDRQEISASLSDEKKDNVFLYREGRLLDVFFVDQITLPFPYFQCITKSPGKISLSVNGVPGGAAITGGNIQNSLCGVVEGSLSPVEADENFGSIAIIKNMRKEHIAVIYEMTKRYTEKPNCILSADGKRLSVIVGYNKYAGKFEIFHFLPEQVSGEDDIVAISYATKSTDETDADLQEYWPSASDAFATGIAYVSVPLKEQDKGAAVVVYDFRPAIPKIAGDFCRVMVFMENECRSDADCISDAYYCNEIGNCESRLA